MRNEAQTWYSGKIQEQLNAGKQSHEVKVKCQISIIKPLQARWITKFYDYIRIKPDIVRNGWKKALITEHAFKKIELDPFANLWTYRTGPQQTQSVSYWYFLSKFKEMGGGVCGRNIFFSFWYVAALRMRELFTESKMVPVDDLDAILRGSCFFYKKPFYKNLY